MVSTMLTLQQQATRLSYVEQNQQTIPQMVNNHVQSSFHNALQDEISSQLHRAGQNGPQVEGAINTNGNNKTSVVRHNNRGNDNNDSNRNGGLGRNSPDVASSDHRDYPREDGRGRRDNYHPGRTLFNMRILESRIPGTLEKPPKLETYDGTTDPDKHLEHIDIVLDYYQAQETIKCKLFVLTLKGAVMTWFKGLEDNSIRLWRELCIAYPSHFTARKRQPVASLSSIIQGREESLRDYIERFTREAIEVKGTNEKLKCYKARKATQLEL
jgi:hypothetical protein